MAGFLLCLYEDDEGNFWRVRRKYTPYSHYPSLFGFVADDATKPFLPNRLKERYALFVEPTSGRHRTVTIGNKTCEAWAVRPVTITMPNADGTQSDYTSQSWFGERALKGS